MSDRKNRTRITDGRFVSLGRILPQAAGRAFRRKGFARARVFTDWTDIVDHDTAENSRPAKISGSTLTVIVIIRIASTHIWAPETIPSSTASGSSRVTSMPPNRRGGARNGHWMPRKQPISNVSSNPSRILRSERPCSTWDAPSWNRNPPARPRTPSQKSRTEGGGSGGGT